MFVFVAFLENPLLLYYKYTLQCYLELTNRLNQIKV